MKHLLIILLVIISNISIGQIIHQDQQIILSIEDGIIYIEPTIPNTHFIVWLGVNKENHEWMEFTSKEYLVDYTYCIGKTIFLILKRYNVEGLNLTGDNVEVYLVGNYSFYIESKL